MNQASKVDSVCQACGAVKLAGATPGATYKTETLDKVEVQTDKSRVTRQTSTVRFADAVASHVILPDATPKKTRRASGKGD